MITKEALDKLQETFLAASAFSLQNGDAIIALPAGTVLHDLDQFEATRRRFSGTFETGDLNAFCVYIADAIRDPQDQNECGIFITQDKLEAVAILDLGTPDCPRHGEHRALLKLATTPEWVMTSRSSLEFNQAEFIDWALDWKAFLSFEDAEGQPVDWNLAVSALRKISLDKLTSSQHEEQTLRQRMTVMEQIEAKGEQPLPPCLRLSTAASLSLPGMFSLVFDIRVSGSVEKPCLRIVLRPIARELLLAKVQTAFMQALQARLMDVKRVYMGTFKKG